MVPSEMCVMRGSGLVRGLAACACVAGAATGAAGQGATVEAVVPATAPAGQAVTVVLRVDVQPGSLIGAVGGFALDFEITEGAEFVESISAPSFPVLNVGTRVTEVTTEGVTGIVGGQFADLDGTNPGLVTGNPIDLFAVDLTIAASAPAGTMITVTASNPDPAGGVFVYPLLSSDTVLEIPNTPSSALTFASATLEVGDACIADVNGDGVASPADFTAWIIAFNTQATGCDQNGDGVCSPADFTAWIINYNAGC